MIAFALALILLFQGGPAARPGVVTGQLRTPEGTPVIAVRVAAMPVPVSNGVQTDGIQYFEAESAVSTALTDNQGRYRLANIPPGRYYIMAGAVGEASYYPATTNFATATIVPVAAGSTTDNVDIRLLRAFGGRVSGRVNPSPSADARIQATLFGGKLEEVLVVPIGAGGVFEFGHVPPGNYLLNLFPSPPGLDTMVVKVGDKDVSGLELVSPPTRTVNRPPRASRSRRGCPSPCTG